MKPIRCAFNGCAVKSNILSDGRLVTVGSPQDLMESTRTRTLEDEYLTIVGSKVDRSKLLEWRKKQ